MSGVAVNIVLWLSRMSRNIACGSSGVYSDATGRLTYRCNDISF